MAREEIMQEVRRLHTAMPAVEFWMQMVCGLVVLTSTLVVALILYQVWLKLHEGRTIRGVLNDVRQYLRLTQDHAQLTDAQKRAVMVHVAEVFKVARNQALKVEQVTKEASAEVISKLEKVPEKTADRVAEKLSPGDSYQGQTTILPEALLDPKQSYKPGVETRP